MKVTFDTNCLINYFDQNSETATSREEIAELLRLATSGRISVAITTRTENDLYQDRDRGRRDNMLSTLAMFDVIGSIARWDESFWDKGDFWADDATSDLNDQIASIVFPGLSNDDPRFANKIRDVDHLTAHRVANRDIFVTDDGTVNRRKEGLRGLGIVVMRPAECLAFVEHLFSQSDHRVFPSISDSNHRDDRMSGTVEFDYSNYNGLFSLGSGVFLFDTKWSKAGDKRIHAYSDGKSVDAVAHARSARDISDVRDAGALDFSSRVRTIPVGGVAIWRNANGVFGATKVLAISDNTRGAERDSLSLEFKILVEGGDFSTA